MNKRASLWVIDSMPAYVIFILFVGFITLLFIAFARQYGAAQYKIPENVGDYIIAERFRFSCFGDGLIEAEKFRKELLDSCYNVEKDSELKGFRLALGDLTIATANWKEPFDISKVYDVSVVRNGIITIEQLKVDVHE